MDTKHEELTAAEYEERAQGADGGRVLPRGGAESACAVQRATAAEEERSAAGTPKQDLLAEKRSSSPAASRSCCSVQAALGWAVTLQWISRRLQCSITTNTCRVGKSP
jgi:hypothetical protein